MIRVLVADDHPVFLEGLCRVLSLNENKIEVLCTAENGEDAIRKEKEYKPDVVLLDIKMPGINGVEATKAIKANRPNVKVIMLTTFDDKDLIQGALKAGANGYILKDTHPDQLIQSIISVYEGNILLSEKVAASMEWEQEDKKKDRGGKKIDKDPYKDFSKRDRDILRLMSQGKDNFEIAEELFISEKTVRNYVSNIYDKLGVHSRTKVVLWALKNRL